MTAQILPPTPPNIALLGERLRSGEIVAMPTETVYGLAASVWNESALAKVFAAKERPKFDPLICHVAAPRDASEKVQWLKLLAELELIDQKTLTEDRYQDAERLAEKFWPGPLTLVLPKTAKVSDLATSGLDTLAIRVPRHPIAQALLHAAGEPLCAPSANLFGRISPTCARDVADELGDRITWILDGGRCEVGLESTVVAFEDEPRILRRGGVSQEMLEAALGKSVAYAPLTSMGSGTLPSPGMLASHYAPRKKLILLPRPLIEMHAGDLRVPLSSLPKTARIGLLMCKGEEQAARNLWETLARGGEFSASLATVATLSPTGNDAEAAKYLFHVLRELDANEATTHLIAEPPASSLGLAAAILDRLERAAH